MPILVATAATPGTPTPVDPVVPSPDPGGGGGGGVSPSPVQRQSASLTLTTADGTVFDLSNRDALLAILGRRGFDATQYDVMADESPGFDGEVFRGSRALPKDLIVPVYIRADTRAEFLTRKRDFLAKLSISRGLATLEITDVDSQPRRIRVYFTGRGAEGEAVRTATGRNWVRYNLELRAPDPFWRGDPLHYEFSAPSANLFFGGSTFLPFRVQSTQTLGTSEFTNPGDVDSPAVWRVYGPTTGDITFTDVTPGYPERTFHLVTPTITAATVILVDGRPEVLSVTDDGGGNRFGDIADGSAFWQIHPGLNRVNVSVSGAGPGTRVTLDAEPRYETA